jgi:hypothetical protein
VILVVPEPCLDFTEQFAGDTLGPIPVRDAVQRVVAFCCSPRSGFLGYDGVGYVARRDGRLAEVGPWSILLADALAGRVSVGNLHDFMEHMDGFAQCLRDVPDHDLASLDPADIAKVRDFCSFGFPGAWAPKITKVGALFRPRTIPVLDGYVALAFGYARDSFSVGKKARRDAISSVINALAARITSNIALLNTVREQAEQRVPAARILSDLRLADIIIWTSQDDRMERPGKPLDAWLYQKECGPPRIEEVKWVSAIPA